MKKLKICQVNHEAVEKISKYLSKEIDKIKQDIWQEDYLEGVFYIGSNLFKPQINIGVIYNHYAFEKMKLNREKSERLEKTTGIAMRIQHIPEWWYDLDITRKERDTNPIEFMLRYGTILYDKEEKLHKIQEKLKKDNSLEQYLDYWHDACKIEPPLQYIKK